MWIFLTNSSPTENDMIFKSAFPVNSVNFSMISPSCNLSVMKNCVGSSLGSCIVGLSSVVCMSLFAKKKRGEHTLNVRPVNLINKKIVLLFTFGRGLYVHP